MQFIRLIPYFLLLTGMVTVSPLKAASSLDEVDAELSVTGSRLPTDTLSGRVPKIVISADEIAALGPVDLTDVLRGVPGVDIMQQGGIGGLTFLSLRGGDPNFVVILLDGVKVNDPTNSRGGAFDIGTIDPAIVERIEIFYGGFSPVHGSDALAGVISITTRAATDGPRVTAGVRVGSGDAFGGSVHVTSPVAEIATLSVSASIQDGDNSSFGDAFERRDVAVSLQSTGNRRTDWNIRFFQADGDSEGFPEDSGGDRLAIIRTPETRTFDQTNISGRMNWRVSSRWRLDLTGAWSRRAEEIANPGIAPGVLFPVPAITSDTEYERTDLTAANIFDVSPQATIVLGAAYTDETGGMNSIIDFGFPLQADYALDRETKGLFAELGLDPADNLALTSSIRYDKSGAIKATTTRLAAQYSFGTAGTLSAQFGEGFKLPSFFALGHPLVGNPDLKPERSTNYELSLAHAFLEGALTTRVSLYRNMFKDLVDFDPINFTNVNRSKVRTKGVEVSVEAKPNDTLTIGGSLTYNVINTFDPDVLLRRRPKWKGSARLQYRPIDTLTFTGRLTINGDYFDSSIPTGMIAMDGYARIDASASWRITDQITARLHMANALSSDAEESIGFANRGRQATVGLSATF